MQNSPFVKDFDELLMNLREDIQCGENSLYVSRDGEDSIFLKLYIQPLTRKINEQEVEFVAIRDIKLKEEFRGNGQFKKFLKELETLNINLIFHDIINDRLYDFLLNQGYDIFKEIKYEEELVSCYKLKKAP